MRIFFASGFARAAAMAVAICLNAVILRAAQPLPYSANFEPPTYSFGATVDGVDGWTADPPTSGIVTNALAYENLGSLMTDARGAVSHAFTTPESRVTLDAYYRGQAADDLPDLSQLTSGSALVAFTAASGIVCLDGDGAGSGVWVSTGDMIDPMQWYHVVLEIDYSVRTYDCLVNGVRRLSGLGFLHDTTTRLNGFRAAAGSEPLYLDDLRVHATVPVALSAFSID